MICPLCLGNHIDDADLPTVCRQCNGSGTTRRTHDPITNLVRAAESCWATAAGNIATEEEAPGLYLTAGRLYTAAARERAPHTPGRAQLLGMAYQCFDVADRRALGRRMLQDFGFRPDDGRRIAQQFGTDDMDADNLAAYAEWPGGAQ